MQRKPRFGFNTHGNMIVLPQNQSDRNVTIIAAMDRNNGIGIANSMPWHVPPDMAQFKRLTTGYPVIMGRKTFVSLGKALPGRMNIVITRDPFYVETYHDMDNVRFMSSLPDAIQFAEDYLRNKDMVNNDDVTRLPDLPVQIFIIGGGQIYKEAMDKDLVDDMILTRFDKVAACDTFFPEPCPSQYTPVAFSSHEHAGLEFKYEYWRHIKPEKE